MPTTGEGIAYDRSGVREATPVLFLHAGVADRRMWDPQWAALAGSADLIRLDHRGFGESVARPAERLSRVDDVMTTMDALGVERAHVVGASLGAGIAVEVALTAPDRVASLLLGPPGGSLLATRTADLADFIAAENAALEAGDLDGAVEANLRAWVVGPGRQEGELDAGLLDQVRRMQRRAFENDQELGDLEEVEMEPPALDRLGEITARTLVVVGGHDLDTTKDATDRVCAGIRQAERRDWPDAAHVLSMERPDRFTDLLRAWVTDPPVR